MRKIFTRYLFILLFVLTSGVYNSYAGEAMKHTGKPNKKTKSVSKIILAPPVNDECSGAVEIVPGTNCSPVSSSLTGATQMMPPSCRSFNNDALDVWFKFTATSSTHTIYISGTLDIVLEAFSGNCVGLISLGCKDDLVNEETLLLTGLNIGEQYYFRYYAYNSSQMAGQTLSICVTTPSATPCNAPASVFVDAATDVSALLKFTPNGTANSYTVTTMPVTDTQIVTTSPVTLSGLIPSTRYAVSINANCGGGDGSIPVTRVFTTSAIIPTPDINGIVHIKKGATGNGSSWNNAFGELADALKVARTNTSIREIWVAAGTYQPLYGPNLSGSASIDRTNVFFLVKDVKIYGGFSASATDGDGMQSRNWKTNPTILSGDFSEDDQYAANGQPIANNSENAYRVVISMSNVGSAELNGFTVKGANGVGAPRINIAPYNIVANSGGGISNSSSSPVFSNIIVTGNNATIGGGIYNAVSNPIFKNVLVNGNKAASYGAGAYNGSGNPSFFNVTISNNLAGEGAIYNTGTNPIMINTIVSGNTATANNNAGISNGTDNISYSLIQNMAASAAKHILDGTKNAQFTDPANGDYTLKSSSPAINAGDPQTNINGINVGIIDLAGGTRIQKGTIDLGAYESAYSDSSLQPDANGIFYVNKGAGGAGTSWSDALGELDEALKAAKTLNAATPGTVKQIWVAKGTYQPALNSAFSLLNNISVYGGFSGTESSLSARNWKTNVTTLKGNGSSVFNNQNLDNTPILDGFIITGGVGYNNAGGGIYNYSASPVISNCIITGNSTGFGGGIQNDKSSPVFINCMIYNNSAIRFGGGMLNIGASSITIINCTIGNNNNEGVYTEGRESHCSVYNSIIWGNTGTDYLASSYAPPLTVSYSFIGGYAADAIHHNLDGNIDPQFTDAANGDFTLKDGSLAVNSGDPKTNSNGYFLQAGDADLANNARIQKGQIDMGAFESANNPVIQPDVNGIFYVKKGSPGNGTSWDNAMSEVADALKLAKTLNTTTPGTVKQIWVGAGTYHPLYALNNLDSHDPIDRYNAFLLVQNVKLYGGFASTVADGAELQDRDWKINQTVLSADFNDDDTFAANGQPTGNNSENAHHVIVSAGTAGSAEVNGFVVTGANGDLGSSSITANQQNVSLGSGGGLYVVSSSPIIANTRVTGNYASSGGGVYNSSASPNLNNVVISGNSAGNGGGIVNYNSTSPIFNNVIIANNTASFGGGMLNQGSSPVLNNVVIYGNTAATYGNGIRNIADSYLLISNSIIYGNSDTGISNGQNVVLDINYSLIEGISANAIKHNLDGSINPKFTDVANNDFTLQASSPAINAGDPKTNTAGYPVQVGGTDIAGNTRIFDGQIDLGAFEHQTKHQVITFSNLVNDTIATVYGDADFSPASSSYSDAIITYSVPANNDAVSIVDGKIHLKNAGDVVITVNATGDSEYDPVSVTKVLRVAPRKLTVTADAQSKVYGDADPAALTYEISFGTLVVADEFTGSLSRDTGENVGTYAIKLGDLALSDNYELTYQGANLKILPATITGVTLSDQTFTYDGTVKSLEVTGLPADASITYTGNDQKESGTYTVTATVTLTNYADLELTAELKINKAASVITADATQTFTYNGTAKSVSGTLNHSETTLSYDPQQSYTNAGSYSITLKSAETANYLESSKTVTLKINPATITGVTLADQTFTYDGTTKSLEVTGLPADASITYTGNDQTDAGTYTVTATVTQTNYEDLELTAELKISKATSVITADATQTFTYNGTAKSVTGTLNHSETTISYDPQQSYTHAGSYSITLKAAETANYLEASKTVTLKINPATITGVTLADRTFTYDGTVKSLEVTGLPADATVAYNGNDQTDAGTYTVTAIVTQTNYEDLELTAELKISKATSVITADATQTFTYNGTAKSVTGTLNHSETTLSYDPQQSYTHAGSYSITLKAAETANYLEASKTVTLKINPATITGVTLADRTFTYDGTAKSLEVTGLPADASVTYTSNDQTDAGTYTVTATVTLTNYEDLELTAELKINKATSVITADATQTFTYDGTAKSVSGTLNHSETTISYDPQQSYTNAGSYSITLKAAETVNYLEASKTVTLKINRATITGITLADQTFTYDGTAKSLEVTGLPADATVAYTGNDQTAAGTYTVTATVTQDNYADLELTAELKISKAASVITADATQTFTYDGTAKSVSGTLNHSETTISYDPQQSYTDAGSYSITLKATETTNYLESTKTVTLKINLATITGVTLTGQTFTYDGTAKSIEIAGLPADATVAYTGNDQTDAGTYTVTATVTQDNYADLELTAELKISKAASVITANATQTFTYDGTAKSVSGTLNHSETTISYDPQQSYTNAGSYSITLNAAETANYLEATKTVTLKINPATITSVTLADQTFTYDGTAKSLEVTGLPSDASVTYTGNDQTDAGTYTVTAIVTQANYADLELTAELKISKAASVITADATQTFTYNGTAKSVSGTLNHSETTLSYAPQQSYTNAGSYSITLKATETTNYLEATKTVTLKINPATITGVTLADQTFTYDGTTKSIEVTGLPAGAIVNYTGNGQTDAGTYTVTATVTQANYADLELTAELKINKAVSVITADATQTFTYDGTAKSVTGMLNHSETTLSYDPQQSYTNAGSYSITLNAAETANYLEATKTVTLKINPATITGVTLADQTFTYDGTAKSLEVTGLPADATVAYTGNDQTDAGTYTVTATVTQANYADLELTAELKISKAASVITADAMQTFTYDGTAKSVSGTLNHSETTISYDPQQSYTNAGSYSITLNAAETENYQQATKTVTLKINPATTTGVTLTGQTFTYDGTAKSLEVAGLPVDATVAYTGNDQTDAGTYTVTATVTQANYADLELTAELKINKGASVITSDATQTFTYDGTAKSVSGTLNHSETTISYDPQQSYTDAGSYSITLKAAETANYLESSKIVTLKINPATITGVTLTDQTFTYDGTAKSLEVTDLPSDASVTYTGNNRTNAGNYTVTATVTQDNYADLELTAELKISKAASVITANATQTFTYDGTAKSVSATLNHSETTISYDPQQSYTDAGSYSITLKAAETTNYLESSKTVTLKINPATITGVTLTAQTYTYNGAARSLAVTGLPEDATITYQNNDQTNAGTYTITATVKQPNHSDLVLMAELKINKALGLITADATQTFTYDGTAKSVSGTLNHSETTISYDPQQSYTDAGSYSITLKAAETANYLESSKIVTLKINPATITGVTLADQTFTYDGTAKSLEVTGLPADATVAYTGNDQTAAGTYTVTATVTQDNYADLELTAELKINKAASVITADATQTFTYDGTAKSVSGTLNHSETTLSYDPQQSYTDAGSYSITLQAAETTNYLESSKTVTLKINPATITGVTLTDQTFTYDGTAKSIEVTGLPVDATIAYLGNEQTNAGTYTITATIKQTNYNDLELTAELKINKAASVITANATQTFTYDGTGKSVTGTLNHSEANISYDPQQSYTNAGSYSITLQAAETANYLESSKTVTLKINKATITGVTLTDQTFTYEGTAKGLAVTGLPTDATVAYSGNGQVNVGTYVITATVKQPNFNDLILTGRLTLIPATITGVALTNQSYVYDATAKNIEVSGLPPGASVIYTGNAQTNAGNYPVTAVVKLANHKDLTLNAELTILQAVLTITANNQTKVYGQPNPPLTLKYDGFAANENESVLLLQPSVSTVATPVSPIGTYPIIAEGASAANYSISYVPGILKINPAAPATIALAAVTVFENRPAGTLVGTLSSTSDDPAAEFSYSLVSGSGDTDNSLFAVSGTRLISSASLDFENKAVYSVRLRSTTQHGFYLDQVFNINISNVNEIPTMAVVSDQTICYTQTAQSVALTGITAGPDAGQNVTLTVSSTNAGLFESLTVNKGAGSTGTLNYRIKAGSSGTAVVTIVVKDDGGTANDGADTYSRSFVITVNALPVVSATSNVGLSLSKGETAVLTATGGVSYRWSSASGIISGQNTAVLTIRPDETATYQVTATNASGCTDVQTITIEVLSDYMAIRTTNILTPNGDGKNDYFIVENIDKYPNNELKVFDRAGRVLFQKRNYDNSFGAIINGSPLVEGTYYYIIDFGYGQPKKKGFITIVRD